MSRHVPVDPWPPVRWDALAVVGGLVVEVPDGWSARATDAGRLLLEPDAGGCTIVLESASPSRADSLRQEVAARTDALVVEAGPDRVLVVLPEPQDSVVLDDRVVVGGGVQVRVRVRCSASDWLTASKVVDDLLVSRWHPEDATRAPEGEVLLPDGRSTARSTPTLPWETQPDVLDHLLRVRDRGLVPAALRRAPAGAAARELGFVGRFGGLTERGEEVLGPVLDHDAVLTIEGSDPGRPGPVERWTCWLQGRRSVVRVTRADGSSSLGIVDAGSLVAHLLAWLDVEPTSPFPSGAAVTITREQYDDRSGPCPSDEAWFREAWTAPTWRFVHGWSHEARNGVSALLVPGVGNLTWQREEHQVTLRPEPNAGVLRSVVEVVTSMMDRRER